jgi:hypothetical protein
MPFTYYQRLSRKNQAIYRQSDRIAILSAPDPKALVGPVAGLERALREAEALPQPRALVKAALEVLLGELCRQFGVVAVQVRVLSRRPRASGSELYALYVMERGRTPRIEIWLKTSQRRQVVAFRTFVRTLTHEFCHHLDYHLFKLADSFHTEGFFKRESSLARQLLPRAAPKPHRPVTSAGPRTSPAAPGQLKLPL